MATWSNIIFATEIIELTCIECFALPGFDCYYTEHLSILTKCSSMYYGTNLDFHFSGFVFVE